MLTDRLVEVLFLEDSPPAAFATLAARDLFSFKNKPQALQRGGLSIREQRGAQGEPGPGKVAGGAKEAAEATRLLVVSRRATVRATVRALLLVGRRRSRVGDPRDVGQPGEEMARHRQRRRRDDSQHPRAGRRHRDLGPGTPAEDGRGDRHPRQRVVAARDEAVVVAPRRTVGGLHGAGADGEEGRGTQAPDGQRDEGADEVRLALGVDVVVVVGCDWMARKEGVSGFRSEKAVR